MSARTAKPSPNGSTPAPLRLVVLGDSTSFTDDRGPLLPDDPILYPNVTAAAVERALGRQVRMTVLASPGAGAREVWTLLTKDRHAQFEVLMGADAVVVGIGSFDHAPAGVPAALEQVLPYLRPDTVRRRVRQALRAAHPHVVRLTRARFTRMPMPEFVRLYGGVLFQVRSLTQGAAGVVLGPTSHRSAYYGFVHPQHAERARAQLDLAARQGFPAVACWPLVEPYADRLNVDGIHWPAEAHAAIGEALAVPLVAQLRGEMPKPAIPDFDERPM